MRSHVTRRQFVQGGMAAAAGALLLPMSPMGARPAFAQSAAASIDVHGWEPSRSTWVGADSGVRNNAKLPGGKYFRGNTVAPAPTGGYVLAYHVDAPVAGAYALSWISTPPDATWASRFDVKVNDGPWKPTSNASRGSAITPVFRGYEFGTVTLGAGANTVTFRVTDAVAAGTNAGHYLFYLNTLTLRAVPLAISRIAPASPLAIFEAHSEMAMTVLLNQPVRSTSVLTVTASDFEGRTATQAHASIPQGEDRVPISLGHRPIGNYRLDLELTGPTTVTGSAYSAVVPRRRGVTRDTPFATDVAASSLVPTAQIGDIARAIRLAGVSSARGRYHWDLVQPTPDHFTFDALDRVVEAISATGVSILEAYNRAPGWMREPGHRLPSDLNIVYGMAKKTAAHNGARVDAWEVWNEAAGAGTSSQETVDQYAAFLKAAAIGYADSHANAKVCITGLGHFPRYYANAALDNDVAAYLDAYSFHGYTVDYSPGGPADYPFPADSAAQVRAFVDSRAPGLDLWMSESGIPIPATDPSGGLTPAEQRAQARYIVTSAVQSVSAGVHRNYWFVLPYYDENGVLYGAFAPGNAGPYPAYSAMSIMTWVLGEGRYLGRDDGAPAGVESHRFDAGHNEVLVLWASEKKTITLPRSSRMHFAVSLMGRVDPMAWRADGMRKVTVGPDPVYLCERRPRDISAVRRRPSNSTPIRASTLPDARRVVLQPRFETSARKNAKTFQGYQLDPEATNTVHCRIYNMNDHAMAGTFSASAPGWVVSPASQSVALGPRETVTLSMEVTRSGTVATRAPLTMTGSFADGSTLAVADIMPVLTDVETTILAGAADPASWDFARTDALSKGGTGSATAGDQPGSVTFTYHFPGDETTGYGSPFLTIADAGGLENIDGFALDIFADEDMPGVQLKLIANQRNGSRYWTAQPYDIAAGWHQVIAPRGAFSFAAFGRPDPNHDFRPETLTSIQVWIATKLADPAPITIKNFGWYTL